MIEISVGTLIESIPTLQKLSGINLKAKAAWQVSRLLREIEKELQGINEARLNIVKKYCELEESGEPIIVNGNYKIAPENIEKCTQESNEFLGSTVEINASLISLNDLKDINFTATEMSQLEKFINFED